MVAVLTLALGIGATTAIFSIIRAVLMNPLAMQDPGRVVLLQEQWRNTFSALSVGNFADVRRQSSSFSNLCALNEAGFNLATPDTPTRVQGELATADCFATFGVPPIAGRLPQTNGAAGRRTLKIGGAPNGKNSRRGRVSRIGKAAPKISRRPRDHWKERIAPASTCSWPPPRSTESTS